MSKLSSDDVLKLARLSRLRLSEEEVERFRHELSEILDYVETLNKVDTKSLQPTYQVTGLKNVMRSDDVRDYGVEVKDLLTNAPAIETGQFKVKRVIG
jgi:aspartyl-tRNA(Asn)/glutamyl-tRNA(Gln) amidotransferase subunit C